MTRQGKITTQARKNFESFKRVGKYWIEWSASWRIFQSSIIIYRPSHKIEVAMKSTGDRKQAISVPPGGSGKLYGIVVVPESCPRGKSSFTLLPLLVNWP